MKNCQTYEMNHTATLELGLWTGLYDEGQKYWFTILSPLKDCTKLTNVF